MDTRKLVEQLIDHEALRTRPYLDTTGHWTIGVGRNLSENGISRDEALHLLDNDIRRIQGELDHWLPWWRELPEDAQLVLADMCFNLGMGGLMLFKKFLAALRAEQWDTAADEMMNSKWARQVGRRATRLSEMIRGLA